MKNPWLLSTYPKYPEPLSTQWLKIISFTTHLSLGVSKVLPVGTPTKKTFVNGWEWWFPTIFYIKIWNHPIETSIYKWLALGFQVHIHLHSLIPSNIKSIDPNGDVYICFYRGRIHQNCSKKQTNSPWIDQLSKNSLTKSLIFDGEKCHGRRYEQCHHLTQCHSMTSSYTKG